MIYIFESNFCPVRENVNLKMFGWEKSPLEYYIFGKRSDFWSAATIIFSKSE